MTAFELLPIVAAAGFVIAALLVIAGTKPPFVAGWLLPAALSAAFLVFSLYAMAAEGPTAVWAEHTRNAWGNQIWLDLLLAVGIAWTVIVPQAQSVGMRPLPWLVAVLLTGCIGLLAMLSRLLYLQQRHARARQVTHPHAGFEPAATAGVVPERMGSR